MSVYTDTSFFFLYISNLKCIKLIPQVAPSPVSEVRSMKPFRAEKQVIMTEGASILALFNSPDHSRLCTIYLQNTWESEWNTINQDLNWVHTFENLLVFIWNKKNMNFKPNDDNIWRKEDICSVPFFSMYLNYNYKI